jgi:hypothetical protein
MNNKFDELTKQMVQSVTRRSALKKFSVGLAGMALACFGLAEKAEAATKPCVTYCNNLCSKYQPGSASYNYCHRVCAFTHCL